MKIINEFINQYGVTFIHSVVALIISYVSIVAKNIYKNYINDRTKKEVVKMVCQAINQLYPNASGSDKLNQAIINTKEILMEKGIILSDLELRMYIEYTVRCFKTNNIDN